MEGIGYFICFFFFFFFLKIHDLDCFRGNSSYGKIPTKKKQSERSDLPCHIIMLFIFLLLFQFKMFNSYLLRSVVLNVADFRDAARFQKLLINKFNKLTLVFYVSILLLIMNFVITLSK